jgi:hypothetical protein
MAAAQARARERAARGWARWKDQDEDIRLTKPMSVA